MSTVNQSTSRIDAALDRWGVQEQKYVAKYGQGIYQDKAFMKARKDSLQKIYDEHKGKSLTFEEKMDLRILKGQLKQMNKMIYPNPTVRVIRGVASFISRPLIAPLKLVADFLSLTFRGHPAFNHKPQRMQPMRTPQMRVVTPNKQNSKNQKNGQKSSSVNNKEQLQQLKRPRRERKMSDSTTKGMSMAR